MCTVRNTNRENVVRLTQRETPAGGAGVEVYIRDIPYGPKPLASPWCYYFIISTDCMYYYYMRYTKQLSVFYTVRLGRLTLTQYVLR